MSWLSKAIGKITGKTAKEEAREAEADAQRQADRITAARTRLEKATARRDGLWVQLRDLRDNPPNQNANRASYRRYLKR